MNQIGSILNPQHLSWAWETEKNTHKTKQKHPQTNKVSVRRNYNLTQSTTKMNLIGTSKVFQIGNRHKLLRELSALEHLLMY